MTLQERLSAYRHGDADARELSDEVLRWFGWTVEMFAPFEGATPLPQWHPPKGARHDPNVTEVWAAPDRPHPVEDLNAAKALMPEGTRLEIHIAEDGHAQVYAWNPSFVQATGSANTLEGAWILAAMAAKEGEK